MRKGNRNSIWRRRTGAATATSPVRIRHAWRWEIIYIALVGNERDAVTRQERRLERNNNFLLGNARHNSGAVGLVNKVTLAINARSSFEIAIDVLLRHERERPHWFSVAIE